MSGVLDPKLNKSVTKGAKNLAIGSKGRVGEIPMSDKGKDVGSVPLGDTGTARQLRNQAKRQEKELRRAGF